MSESKKFTPGPWFNGQDGFNLGCGVVYARHANGNPKDVATIRGWGSEQQENARLIASAPDLLEALDALVKINEDHNNSIRGVIGTPPGWNDSYLDAARKALAKARGQQ